MRLDEARALIHGLDRPRDSQDDFALYRNFDGSPPEVQARVREAMALWLEQGSEAERHGAAQFFGAYGIPESVVPRAVSLYEQTGAEDVATLLAGARHSLPPKGLEALRRLFVSDPERHRRLAPAALRRDPDGAAWTAFAGEVRREQDPARLLEAFQAAYATEREESCLGLMREKPHEVVRAMAERMIDSSGNRLLIACGLPPRSRIPRAAVIERLAAREACLLETAVGRPDQGRRTLIYVAGEALKVVHYDPPGGPVRFLRRYGRERLPGVIGHLLGTEVPETWVAPYAALPKEALAALDRRERSEARLRQRLRDGSHWIQDGTPPDGTRTYLRHCAAIEWHLATVKDSRLTAIDVLNEEALAATFDRLLGAHPAPEDVQVPPALRQRLEEATAAAEAAWRGVRAGKAAVRWPRVVPAQLLAWKGKAVSEVYLQGARVAGWGREMVPGFESRLRDDVLGAAARGELDSWIVSLDRSPSETVSSGEAASAAPAPSSDDEKL